MKKDLFKYISIFILPVLLLTSCLDGEDLMTEDAMVGGLVIPTSSNIPYKLGATPSMDIGISVPVGPGIESVAVECQFFTYVEDEDGKLVAKGSNITSLGEIAVNATNESEIAEASFTITYDNLKDGIISEGSPLPDDETQLKIGDYWELSFVSIMSSDSREVVNNAKTSIAVANKYAGYYQVDGTFDHPTGGVRAINEEKFLTPIDANTCSVTVGDLGSYGYVMYITVDPATNLVTFSNGSPAEIIATAGKASYYEPATGKFYLYYYYVGSNGNRIMEEEYTPL
jgi:hypothetical protein